MLSAIDDHHSLGMNLLFNAPNNLLDTPPRLYMHLPYFLRSFLFEPVQPRTYHFERPRLIFFILAIRVNEGYSFDVQIDIGIVLSS
jgi:hypothetical protein